MEGLTDCYIGRSEMAERKLANMVESMVEKEEEHSQAVGKMAGEQEALLKQNSEMKSKLFMAHQENDILKS